VSALFDSEIGPGVTGYTMDIRGDLYVPLIQAVHPGNGDVGRYLDSLPTGCRIVVPNVISARLEGMLLRRGFEPIAEWFEDFGEYVPCWHRRSA
jgi:hypothetical protein